MFFLMPIYDGNNLQYCSLLTSFYFSMMGNADAKKTLVGDNVMSAKLITGATQNGMSAIVSIRISITIFYTSLILECNCDIYGSETTQCDRKTGACVCRPGIGGYNCDICDRGYIGVAPNCQPCGECFDNWDRILKGYQSTYYCGYIYNVQNHLVKKLVRFVCLAYGRFGDKARPAFKILLCESYLYHEHD